MQHHADDTITTLRIPNHGLILSIDSVFDITFDLERVIARNLANNVLFFRISKQSPDKSAQTRQTFAENNCD
ncbi:hypothetical protein TUM4630_22870 [Shewanella algidipiscicola]|uniref:Uncharacterized protein n=1 Tax=Shewanella algidipiscicola TaxID=614070 RepID=A0ABQ4PJG5_9GAMM|nr:hypothetical protein TUM4630_22870 [Shewanella algidipiscicola]